MIYLVICLTWFVWAPAALLEKAARGDPGGFSFVPVIPLFPAVGCLAAWIIDKYKYPLGTYTVGGAHLLLLAAILVSCGVSVYRIRRRRM